MKHLLKKLGNKRNIMLGALLLAIVLVPTLALAQTDTAATATAATPFSFSSATAELYQKIIDFLVMAFEVVQKMLLPILLMIGALLENDILFASSMEDSMLLIWTQIRNIVNILFVLVLLGIAFYNVVGGKQQDYHIKTMLPKFVIALIAVNFSFLMVKVSADTVNVMTTAIFALPDSIGRGLEDAKVQQMGTEFCPQLYKQEGKDYQAAVESVASAVGGTSLCTGTEEAATFTDDAQRFFSRYDSNNAAIVLAFQLAEMGKFPKTKEGVVNLQGLGMNIIFSAVMYVVVGVAFIALFIILLARVVALWILAVLSPLLFLQGILPEKLKPLVGGGSDMKEKFIKTLIAPIPIAITMSIGFIMVSALKTANFGGGALSTSTLGVGMQVSGFSTFQDLLAAFATVAFVWMGVFSAASGTLAEKITDGLKGAVEGAGKFIATAPLKYAPIFPVTIGKNKEPVSLATMGSVVGGLGNKQRRDSQNKAEEILGEMGFGGEDPNIKKMRNAASSKEVMTSLMNVKDHDRGNLKNERFQSELATQLKTKKQDFIFNKIGEYKNREEFIDALQKGAVKADTFEEWINDNHQVKFPGITAENPAAPTAPVPPAAGATATAPAAGVVAGAAGAATTIAAAKNLAAESGTNLKQQALSPQQNEAFNKAASGQPLSPEEEPLLQQAVDILQQIKAGQETSSQNLAGALAKEKPQEKEEATNTAIRERRQTVQDIITKNNPGIAEPEAKKLANLVLWGEIEPLMTKNHQGIANMEEAKAVKAAAETAGVAQPPSQPVQPQTP